MRQGAPFTGAMRAVRLAYAAWAGLLFLVLACAALCIALVLPGLGARRRVAHVAAGTFLACAGMPVRLRGAGNLPSGQCVLVANHASYLDGIALTAALPARFGFVIKREMARVPLANLLLERLGSEFVERFDHRRGARDARRVLRSAARGHSLVFFPEGTFTAQTGVHRFHTGAFVAAVRAGCPVVPAVIRGTRRALPPEGGLPRPALLTIEILPALTVRPGAGDAVVDLRDRARAAILEALGEPDLTCSGDSALPPHTAHSRSARASST